jgi:hypothetical protein
LQREPRLRGFLLQRTANRLQPRRLAYEFMSEFGNSPNAGKSTNALTQMLFVPTWR